MVTFLLCQFVSITFTYFNFPTVKKIDLTQEDIKIDYYTVLKDEDWLDAFQALFGKSSVPKYQYYFYLSRLFKIRSLHDYALTIDQLLLKVIMLNLSDEFYNRDTFYNNNDDGDKINTSNHIHQGYIIKDIYSNIRVTKFWTYKLNKTIEKRIKVVKFKIISCLISL